MCVFYASGAWATLWEARTALEQFKKAMITARETQNQGSEEDARKSYSAAEEQLKLARRLFDEADAIKSDDIEVLMEYAEVLQMMNDSDLASEALERAIKLEPGNAKAWLALGRAYTVLGESHVGDAANAFRKVTEILPGSPDAAQAMNALGAAYYEAGLFELSRESAEEALKQDSNLDSARVLLAALDVREGKVKEAADTLDNLGDAGAALGPLIQSVMPPALDAFDEAGLWFEDDATHHAAYGKLLLRVNRVPQSLAPFERAVKLNPNDYILWNLLASARRFMDDTSGVREAYTRSLAVNPNQPRVREALDALAPAETPTAPAPAETVPAPADSASVDAPPSP